MAEAILYPFDTILPSQLLSQYSEWIYFGLILVFFISISGVTLRKHFDQPYVKPLIISVGLMLTVGVFMFKKQLVMIFEGWGILGLILLVLLVATIPFGLCRGYGMPAKNSLYLTYILMYIVAWFKFPEFYYSLAKHNLGLVNLGLLILFFVAVFKMIPLGKRKNKFANDLVHTSPFRPEIQQEMETQNKEKAIVKNQAVKITKFEIQTIEDMAETLAEIQRIVEANNNNMPREEREKIANILQILSKKENILKEGLWNLQKNFKHLGAIDAEQLQNLKDRLKTASKKERIILKSEIEFEEQKLRAEKMILNLEARMNQYSETFNKFLAQSVEYLGQPEKLYEIKDNFARARLLLKDISEILKETENLEGQLVKLTGAETSLLKKEAQTA